MTELNIPDAPLERHAAAVCLGCGCMCDDIAVSVDGGRSVGFDQACDQGLRWYEAGIAEVNNADFSDTVETDVVERLTRSLLESKSPVVFGLTQTSTEAVRAALELADRVRARMVLNRSQEDRTRAAAFQNVGRVTSTLGEVKNRSDLVVFWGCDPATTHPRHAERYSTGAPGRFLPEGRAGRTVVVIDSQPTATSASADLFIQLEASKTLEFVTVLRLLLLGKAVNDQAVLDQTGVERPVVEDLLERCRKARYGSLFFRSPDLSNELGRPIWESLLTFIRDLNDLTRFVILGLGSPGNLAGAEAALTWQTGQLLGSDFREGFPESLDQRASLNQLLETGDVDLLLVIADKVPDDLSPAALRTLATIPCFVVAPRSRWSDDIIYAGRIDSSTFGIDSGGTATRVDGLALPVTPILKTSAGSEKFWIDAILREIEATSSGSHTG